MIRKIALALALVAGTAFVAQPAFANDKAKEKTEKTAKKDSDSTLAKMEADAQKATQQGKTELAAAITKQIEAYNALKEAKNSNKDAAKIAEAKTAFDKATKDVDAARKKAGNEVKKEKEKEKKK